MAEFLEAFILLSIFFRWPIFLLGSGIIFLLIYIRRRINHIWIKWIINFIVVVILIVVLMSLYQISGIDFNLFPESTWF